MTDADIAELASSLVLRELRSSRARINILVHYPTAETIDYALATGDWQPLQAGEIGYVPFEIGRLTVSVFISTAEFEAHRANLSSDPELL